jgi:hypothetical protein
MSLTMETENSISQGHAVLNCNSMETMTPSKKEWATSSILDVSKLFKDTYGCLKRTGNVGVKNLVSMCL